MKTLLRHSFAAAVLVFGCGSAAFAGLADEPGYLDLGSFTQSARGELVEVNLSPALIRFAARIARTQEPEVADVLANLKSVRVNVVKLDDRNRADTLGRIAEVRQRLEAGGWNKVVIVREQGSGDNVDVYVRQQNDDVIQGLVVTVVSRKGEAVLVNVVGDISADRLADVAAKFNLEPLRKLKLRSVKS